MENKRISEAELILPSLYILSKQVGNAGVSTSDLIRILTELMKPKGADSMIINGRKNTYFSQKVRNLKSHNSLIKDGYATYENGKFFLTDEGCKYVSLHKDIIKYLFASGFRYDDIMQSLLKINKNKDEVIIPFYELVNEGRSRIITTKVAERSRKLRLVAIDYFTKNGIIKCDCCGFEFNSYYGDKYGVSCIEIHHIKPIFEYGSIGLTQSITKALENLLPVCPNCHRVIHKCGITSDGLNDFKKEIQNRKIVV